MCAHFLELPFLKCNENAVFSVKNTYDKGKGSFLFESDIFGVFLVVALEKAFSK